MPDPDRLRAAYEQVRDELLAERTEGGWWIGELSSSALATATALSALAVVRSQVESHPSNVERLTFDFRHSTFDDLISRGVDYLVSQQNPDGGFGDTDLSHSNIATTYLVVAALHLAGVANEHEELLARANAYIETKGRLAGLRKRYGIDKTFVVPIMTNLALAGLLDWREIDPLPFELACVPQSLYRFVGMPVVSYAIPALVAIGQARYFHAPPRNPFKRIIRWLSITRSLAVLRRMQPDSGGYLEATPLTSFVVMSLASKDSGFRVQASEAEVIREGVKFLAASVRPDGSWPIDTNLATWNTTLAINALAGAGEDVAELLGPQCLDWLLSCQHTKRHPFTGTDPGGFGWSDLSGAVPDADDTPGALLAMDALRRNARDPSGDRFRIERVNAIQSLRWLMRLQNRNGGWPTFCRGWGRLPFDRSGTDLTAHALRARQIWDDAFGIAGARYQLGPNADKYMIFPWERAWRTPHRALKFLKFQQHPDGSWSPLWFGNQDHPTEDNPVYGTAKVLFAYRDLGLMDSPEAQRGVAWLVANQNADGGWGSGVWEKIGFGDLELKISGTRRAETQIPNLKSSVEETALAVEALLAAPNPEPRTPGPALARGLAWLIDRVEAGQHRQPAPIGFYFAKLWYYERLYPLTFTVAALGRACRQFARPTDSGTDRTTQLPGSP
jgi:squalene-hopene/tetraprenyl-beta-curcumene cyclase